ncbi:poly(rC)-binding protein 3-like isoform X2 [Mytilus californianus]|uniref:poly(rC)-binding protein 3-like isoform X2 n=1 Tax=Mytilus californianus TaxID=6549 RepID=UPI0022461FA4|nr:poly(rC)-binding protein 3-like isoform X2 [Mytilus californianus]
MATDINNMVQNDNSPPTMLTVRMIMQGKEVGSIIGKKGDNIKKFREDSGAKINISDGSCPERIVTVTGTTDCINKAFTFICKKFEEDLQNTPTVPKPPVTLRLVVPASQCGSLIGKGGSKIKEIRETTGAQIQVASEMLPNSTERAVTVSGTADAITACIQNICNIMLESPPKGATIQYRPKPVVPPVIFTGGQAYTVPGGQIPMTIPEMNKLHQISLQQGIPIIPTSQPLLPTCQVPWYQGTTNDFICNQKKANYVITDRMHHAPGIPVAYRHASPAAIPQNTQQTHEISIPNDLIGCIIGRGGQKINEIRQMSGAMIKISNAEEGSPDRKVTITGTIETIGLAQYLINTSMELHKNLTLDPTTSTIPTTSASPLTSVVQSPQQLQASPYAITLNQLAMNSMNSMNSMNMNAMNMNSMNMNMNMNALKQMPAVPYQLGQYFGMIDTVGQAPVQQNKMRVGVAANAMLTERKKIAPY